MLIDMFDGNAITRCAGCDDQVDSRHGQAIRPGALRQINSTRPNQRVDWKTNHELTEMMQRTLLCITSRSIPQFYDHDLAPGRFASRQQVLNALPYVRTASGAKSLDPT